MAKIELDIPEELIRQYGIEAIQERLQKLLDFENLGLLAKQINVEIESAGQNYNSIMEEARVQAWENLRHKYLKDIE